MVIFLGKLAEENSRKKASNDYTKSPLPMKPTISPQLSVLSNESDVYEDVDGLQPPPYSEAYDMPNPQVRPVTRTDGDAGIYSNVGDTNDAFYEDMDNPTYVNKPWRHALKTLSQQNHKH